MTPLDEMRQDLDAEQRALDALVAPLAPPRWATPTPSEGWAVRDQIAHLAHFDEAATLAVTDPEGFARAVADALQDFPGYETRYLERGRALARLRLERRDTDRVRHILVLGVRTRAFAYALRGLPAPAAPVRVELVLPSGARWEDGEAGAENRIAGAAVDFCRVVTHRRHVDDTALLVEGPAAREWMLVAQAYAGPPAPGRKPGQFPRANPR